MKHLLWFGLIVLILTSSTFETSVVQHKTALGKGFYLPERNIIEDSFIGGANIFEMGSILPEKCLERTRPGSTGKISSDTTFYKDTKSFYHQIGASLGLSGSVASYFTLSGALRYVAGTRSNYAVSGTSLNVKSIKEVMGLSQNCINTAPLSKQMLEAFDLLPTTISFPNADVAWDAYATFLNSYGSHVATQAIHGSQLIQWEFARADKEYSQKELTARACLDLLNQGSTNPTETGVGACAGVSTTDLEAAANVYTKSMLSVIGGSVETQTKLRNKEWRTEEAIVQLLQEGKGDNAGTIGYEWKALYDILLQRFPDGDRNIKAKNLRMYYEGMKSYGCQIIESGRTTLREFVLNEKHGDPTEFECRVPGEGCHDDSDCHFAALGCYCYGRSCIEKVTTQVNGEEREQRAIKQERSGKSSDGVNRSCYLKMGQSCKCDKEKMAPEWETVWSYGSLVQKKGNVPSAVKKHKASEKELDEGEKEGSAVSP